MFVVKCVVWGSCGSNASAAEGDFLARSHTDLQRLLEERGAFIKNRVQTEEQEENPFSIHRWAVFHKKSLGGGEKR